MCWVRSYIQGKWCSLVDYQAHTHSNLTHSNLTSKTAPPAAPVQYSYAQAWDSQQNPPPTAANPICNGVTTPLLCPELHLVCYLLSMSALRAPYLLRIDQHRSEKRWRKAAALFHSKLTAKGSRFESTRLGWIPHFGGCQSWNFD